MVFLQVNLHDVTLTKGERTIKFVINENGAFNFRGFSIGAYINAQVSDDVLKKTMSSTLISLLNVPPLITILNSLLSFEIKLEKD